MVHKIFVVMFILSINHENMFSNNLNLYKKAELRTYGESCDNNWSLPCDYSVGLICPTADNICQMCPNNILSYHCDCPLYKWWNGTHCGNLNFFN